MSALVYHQPYAILHIRNPPVQRAVHRGNITKKDLARRQYEPSAVGSGSGQPTIDNLFAAMNGHKDMDMNHFARKLIRNAASNERTILKRRQVAVLTRDRTDNSNKSQACPISSQITSF